MSPDEALRICRLAKALSPAQAIDEYTPEAWSIVLRKVAYPDAVAALEELGGEREWIHVSHIKGRVERIRDERERAFGPAPTPPAELIDDHDAYYAWIKRTRAAIRSGDVTRGDFPRPAVEGATTPERKRSLRELAGRSVDDA